MPQIYFEMLAFGVVLAIVPTVVFILCIATLLATPSRGE